ncbi:2-hydroxy-3-oxopropionate reductase [Nannizzia gypsea CBS 118893]|uniref:2-hydroxy-3-oxopropionate reductase n=1 Tax=Arthroderma gypseum (strain ATCC MYA-4604 / CBS 118893) TaxID=535722 RepID=E4UNI1_ARTGP|nr:2-hydroxy-3-oxopropionate reductase [Nannizzia gypsea CBS 118893]EFQ99589.1 2-hydroxy-3-oxopropionate reductase [Nannizzia gypsea CBS 118893]
MAITPKPTVGFVGLGAMGFGMAVHLITQGYSVKGFDTWAPALERFREAGGNVAASLEDSAKGCMYYVCMVASAPQVQSILFDDAKPILKALPFGATFILCSTVPAAYAQSVRDQLASSGRGDISFIDAPVSGGAIRAANGTLSIMAGGSDTALERGRFLLAEMSDAAKLYLVPGGVGAGSNMKMVHQVLAGIHILAASEAMGFAARLGLDAQEVCNAIVASDAWSWMHENRSPRMLKEDYFPGVSALTIILKDVTIITKSARLHQFPVPLSSTAEQIYVAGLSPGYGADDDAGMVRMYYPEPISKVKSPTTMTPEFKSKATNLVISLLRHIHLCAAAEAIAFARFLSLDMAQFYELVNAAAGGSFIFKSKAMEMINSANQAGTSAVKILNEAVDELSDVVQEARNVDCPLHLGAAALGILHQAKFRGWGKDSDSSVIRLWETHNEHCSNSS